MLKWVCVVLIGPVTLNSVEWEGCLTARNVWQQERGSGGLLLPWCQEGEIAGSIVVSGMCSVCVSHSWASQSAVDPVR